MDRVPAIPRPDAPRWFHEWFAESFGFFWLPCPLCKREFGGHECRGRSACGVVETPPGPFGEVICPICTALLKGPGDGFYYR